MKRRLTSGVGAESGCNPRSVGYDKIQKVACCSLVCREKKAASSASQQTDCTASEQRAAFIKSRPSMYAKIFQQIYSSSIAQDYKQRLVFMDMLVLADQNGVVDMTHEGIARFTNVPVEIVREAIAILESPDPQSRNQEQQGARIVRLDSHRDWGWWIVNYDRYRSIASEEQRREKTRKRVSQFRERQRLVSCNAPVTVDNAGNAKEREKQKERQMDKEKRESAPLTSKEGVKRLNSHFPLEAVFWNDHCGSLPKVKHVSQARMRHLLTRRKDEFWRDNFETAVGKIAASSFCCGEKGWVATFDWIIKQPDTVTKIMEGKYDNRQSKERGRSNPRNEGICRGPTDYGELARRKSAMATEARRAQDASSEAEGLGK